MAGRLGFGIAAVLGSDVAAALAPEVERLGYAQLWTNDGAPAAGLPLVAAAQRASARIVTGVGVIPCDLRSPGDIVAAIGELGIDPRRAVIGIGSGRAEHPVEAVREAAAELRRLLPQGVRLAVAALGPRMCRLAGEVADVVLLNWVTPERIRWSRRRIAEGERRGGRRPGQVVVASYVRVAVGPGARERLAAEASRYARIPAYARSFAAMAVDPGSVGIAAEDPRDVAAALAPYREVLDETVVRALPAANDAASVLAVARAAGP